MKRITFMLALLMLVSWLIASTGTIKLPSSMNSVDLINSNANGLSIRYAINELNTREITSKEGIWTELSIANYTKTNIVGSPALPLMRQLISVPLGAEVHAVLNGIKGDTINLNNSGIRYPLMPFQESVSKSADLNALPFVVNRDFYNSNVWTTNPSISVTELGMMRGIRMFAVDFVPLRYNPGNGQIEVIYNAEAKITFTGGDYAATQALQAKTYSPAFEGSFAGSIINYEPTRATLNRYPLGYVIILPDTFVAAMQPFIEWKRREGYNVIVAPTSVTGTTSNNIKTYMQNMWNAATTENPAPSYLLIVGDVAQVPSTAGTTATHPTDLPYVRLQGTDFMPEMYFGRFSATTAAEVTNQVNKTLMHEQYTMPSDAYLGEAIMIAGVDGTYGPSHANGQINYGTGNYFNTAHGITSHTYMYPASGSSDAAIVANASSGVGYINYTAHGDVTLWADPTFTISNINSLQNVNESSFVVGNCCLTSKFDNAICFAEAWLRAPNKGGIIYIGGTNSTYWDEDYYWAVGYKPPVVASGSPFIAGRTGAYDAVFHDHSEPIEDWAGNAGSMMFMGNLAVVRSNSSRINYYWEIYSIMGDPSLVPYMGIPVQNSYQAPEQMFMGMSALDIQADPYSYVALSMNNVLHGVGMADATGALTLNYTPFTEPGTAQIVVTRSLRKPVIANVQVIPNVGPYVTAGTLVINDGNNNVAEAGEMIDLSLTFSNVGIQDAANLTATIATSSQWVTLNTSTSALPNIPAGNEVTLNQLFNFTINPNIPDQTVVPFEITVTNGSANWVTTRNLIVNAPNVMFGNHTLFDSNGNGIFESGETVTITLDINNTGHMNAGGGTLQIVLNTPHATVTTSTFTIPSIAIGNGIPVSFNLFLAAGIPDGTMIPIGLALDAGIQMLNHNIIVPIGAVGEGFETNNFTAFPWINN
ncbi:MAG: C25 family cysteine peptidase, partial [Candidatus Cloacimonetes bacterium]|nr:C25 family cysteine peptidase [Candidatus Cloacimonadota bacterium]